MKTKSKSTTSNPLIALPDGQCVRRDIVTAIVKHEALNCIGIVKPCGLVVHFYNGILGCSAWIACASTPERDALAAKLGKAFGAKGLAP